MSYYTLICGLCSDKRFIDPESMAAGKPRHVGVGYAHDGSQVADQIRLDADHEARPVKLTRQDAQKKMLAQAASIIREAAPLAVTMDLETSDQSRYGFVLMGLKDASGRELLPSESQGPEHPLYRLDQDVADELSDLDWNGVVGENKHGYATIVLADITG